MVINERIFRHSFGKLALMYLPLILFGVIFIASDDKDYFFVFAIVVGLFFAVIYSTSSVQVNNDGITASKMFITKSLRWIELDRVSTRGQTLRLHNRDEDVTLSLDSQLEGYSEILDMIFSKRPDLFDVGEDDIMRRGLIASIFTIGFGLVMIGLSVFLFFEMPVSESFLALIFTVLGLSVIVSWCLAPQSIVLEDKALFVLYFFKEKSYSINDIASVSLEKTRTRNGYIYFVQLNLKIGKPVKLPGFSKGSILTCQILKRWHGKALEKPISFL
jgi:hypothetical protein